MCDPNMGADGCFWGAALESDDLTEEIGRMRCRQWMLVLAVLGAAGIGCQKSDPKTPESASAAGARVSASVHVEPPAAAVGEFLQAIREGDDSKAASMFTSTARDQVTQLGIEVAPRGSDTATFQVGEVQYLEGGGARVAATWTDVGPDGNPRTDDMLWMLRRSPEGWRIAGMAATVFADQPPLLLDFENLEETLRKLDMLRAALQDREQENPTMQAQRSAGSQSIPR